MRRHLTYFKKTQFKGLLLFCIITLTLFVGVNFLSLKESPITTISVPEGSSNLELPWSGTGDPNSARAYIQKLSSEYDQTDEFGISVPTSPSVLHSANLNFTILSGSETTHEFEQDSPLYYPRSYKNSRNNPHWSAVESLSTDSLSINRGVETPLSYGFGGLVDESVGTALIIQNNTVSPADNEVTITYTANFTGVTNYVRLKTVGFRIYADRFITKDVSANIYLYNYNSLSWDLLYTENWENVQTVETVILPNTRITYLDANNLVHIRIELTDQNAFTITYRDLKVEALIAVQASISTLDYAAMEFDILGDANVSGFYAWIRTLTPSVPGAELQVSLYRANTTAKRADVVSPTKIAIQPDTSIKIASNNITNFATDEYVFIPFKSDYSEIELNVSNYFVVLSADTSNVYAVVTIPYSDSDGDSTNNDPDLSVDHLFLTTDNGGVTWEKNTVGGGQVDAAPFAINVTRPYLPEEINMKIDGRIVKSISNITGIYTNTSGYKWGLGNWKYDFQTEFQDISYVITVPIEFNTTITPTLDFNITYSVIVYAIESTSTNFYAELNEEPSWEVNYTLNKASYTGWNYINSSFAIPSDWILNEFLDTSYTSLMDEYEYSEAEVLTQYWIENTTDGTYSINATSPNYIYEMNSYLQYEENYWETHGFMRGDNISISLGVLNYSKTTSEIFLGQTSCDVYDPDNNKIDPLTMIDAIPDSTEAKLVDNENILITVYDFNSDNLLNTTGSTEQGEYSLVFKWNYGNEVGYKVLPIFIMDYQVAINTIFEDVTKKMDVVQVGIERNLTTARTYNVSLFAIEDITGDPLEDSYQINESIGQFFANYGFNVNVSKVLVNETLLNPGETVKMNVTMESINHYWENDVTLNVQFLQSTNFDWIVMENSTSFQLGILGSGTENYTAELEFVVPDDYKGINSPIRLNPFKLKLEVEINGAKLSPIYLDTLFPFIEKPESELEGFVREKSLIHYRPGPIGYTFSAEIARVEELVHSEALYLMQLSDSYYVACTNSAYDVFTTKPIAQFDEVSVVDLVWGKAFQIHGSLEDEFGAAIDNQNITVEIYNGTAWNAYNQTSGHTLTSNNGGFFNGTYATNVVSKSNSLKFRLSWIGNTTIFGASSNYQFAMITYNNQIQIEMLNVSDYVFLKEKKENFIQFKITNVGNSTMKDINVNFDFLEIENIEEYIRIGDLALLEDKQLEPTEYFYIDYYVTIPGSYQGDTGTIILSVECENFDSYEEILVYSTFELIVLTSSFLDNLDTFFLVIFFVGLLALIIGTVYYGFKTNKKLQQIPQKQKQIRPRRGRYVEVAKLQKQPTKTETTIEPEEGAEEKTADLDDLLKEEGLED